LREAESGVAITMPAPWIFPGELLSVAQQVQRDGHAGASAEGTRGEMRVKKLLGESPANESLGQCAASSGNLGVGT